MKKFTVSLARTVEEYASVTIEAASAKEAKAKIKAVFVDDDNSSKEHCDLVNSVSWDLGETHDERITEVSALEESNEAVS